MKRVIAFLAGAVMLMGAASCSLDNKKSSVKKATDSEIKQLIGQWEIEGEDQGAIIAIENSSTAWIGAVTDYSSKLGFKADGSFICGGETYSSDQYTFTDGKFNLSTPDGNDMSMVKVDGNNSDIYGDYEMKSGDVYKAISKGYASRAKQKGDDSSMPQSAVVGLSCAEGKSELQIKFPADIEIYGDTLFLELKNTGDLDNMSFGTCTYKVVGDKLYLKKGDDTKFTLNRRHKFGEDDAADEDLDEPLDPNDFEDKADYMAAERERLDKKVEKDKAKLKATMDAEMKKAISER
jgi:hypothetical protein